MPVLALFLLLPLLEIAGFVLVGGWIGLGPTLALVILTSLLGIVVLRRQGEGLAFDLRGDLGRMRDPVSPVAHRAMKSLAGMLLILPGFLTDLAGLALLVPAVRRLIMAAVASRMAGSVAFAQARQAGQGRDGGITVIDAEYYEVEPGSEPPRGQGSGWTRP